MLNESDVSLLASLADAVVEAVLEAPAQVPGLISSAKGEAEGELDLAVEQIEGAVESLPTDDGSTRQEVLKGVVTAADRLEKGPSLPGRAAGRALLWAAENHLAAASWAGELGEEETQLLHSVEERSRLP